MGGYFDIQRDNQSPYFCQACVVGKTEEQMAKTEALKLFLKEEIEFCKNSIVAGKAVLFWGRQD